MRRSSLTAGRLRWSALAIAATAVVALMAAASAALAVSAPTSATTTQPAPTAIIASTSTVAQPGSGAASPALQARLLLMPQGLAGVLRSGIAVRISSNEPADAVASVSISQAAARRAQIKATGGAFVEIALGTASQVKDGTVNLRLKLSRATVSKLRSLQHLTLTVRLSLVATGGGQSTIHATGRY